MIDLSPLKAPFRNKPLAVMGLGRSGLSVVEACAKAGIAAVAWDDDEKQRAAARDKGAGIEDLAAADFSRFAALCLAPGIALSHPAALRAKGAGVEILGDIELFRRAKGNVRVIGITGTNGKSTATALVGHILKETKMPSATGGNIGTPVLDLPDLQAASLYVLEMSSYQLDLCPTFSPDIAVLINFSPDHLERHGGMDGYVAAKEKIFRGKGTAVIGVDDKWSHAVYERVKKAGTRRVIPVSCQKSFPDGVTVTADGILYDKKTRIIDLKTCPNLRGPHNWQNAAMAYAACQAAGAPSLGMIKGMQSFPGLAHRQNIVATINGVVYVNDSKATNDQAASVALRAYNPVYWIAGGRPKEGGYHDCEKYLGHVRHSFLIGEAAEAMGRWLELRKFPFTQCGTLDRAVEAAHELAQREAKPGAAVLLSPACASWDQFRSFEHRGEVFTELVKGLAVKKAVIKR